MIRQNISYKLLALVIAIVIWIYVNAFQTASEPQSRKNIYASTSFIVPLMVKNVGRSVTVARMPEQITVGVEGRQEDITAITAQKSGIVAFVDLYGKPAGRSISPVVVKLPDDIPGIRKWAEPRSVEVILGEKVHREMGIDTQFVGLPPESYRFSTPDIFPANATISGTKQAVDAVNRLVIPVNAEKLTDKGIDGSFSIVALDAEGRKIKDLALSPSTAYLHLRPLADQSERALFVSLSTVGQPQFPFKVSSIQIRPQAVIVAGKPSDLATLSVLQTEPVQLSGRTQTFTQSVKIVAPSGVTFPEGGNVDVTVKITSVTPPANQGKQQSLGTGQSP